MSSIYGSSKLTDAQTKELRSLAGTMSQKELGKMFGISQTQAGKIINGKARVLSH